jgi:hypothetical protein
VLRAASPVTPDPERVALRAILAEIAELDIFGRPARVVDVKIPEGHLGRTGGGVFHTDGSTIVIAGEELSRFGGALTGNAHTGVEVGAFAVPPKWTSTGPPRWPGGPTASASTPPLPCWRTGRRPWHPESWTGWPN